LNPKIERMTREIEKLKEKIAESQTRLRELEKQKTEMENSEILAMFRTHNIGPNELADFIRLHREQGGVPVAPVPDQYDKQPEVQEDENEE